MRNSRHLRCAGQHTSEGSSSCVFVRKFLSFVETQDARATIHAGFGSGIAGCRLACRCKVILAFVQGKSPTTIAAGGLCSPPRCIEPPIASLAKGLQGYPTAGGTTARTRSRRGTNGSC